MTAAWAGQARAHASRHAAEAPPGPAGNRARHTLPGQNAYPAFIP
ncbi:hypothetical protein HMPREF0551_0934 [Lautropia mirabilis ATCC 51599]|uniref:Uncharacterized protein n=1 Tax=Lautropia mirabilis ATCC 51599 TaxID=887898 RepID=E7RVW3_9BURK|nr:hypothetical protein HMPREF0551_0934 [Lautropia mirabilis ATCC 51599]